MDINQDGGLKPSAIETEGEIEDDQSGSFLRDTWQYGVWSFAALAIVYANPAILNTIPFLKPLLILSSLGYFASIGMMLMGGSMYFILIAPFWLGEKFVLIEDQVMLRLKWVFGTMFMVGIVQGFFNDAPPRNSF